MYAIFKEPFDAIGCLAYIICGGSIGIVIGYIIKAVHGQDEGDVFANATGVTMYNMYAGVHNLRVLSGSTIGSGREYPKVCVNLQTDVRYNYSVWRLFLWQEEKTAHKKQQ